MKNFGLNRVIEPAGSLPVTAWKLDNDPELKKGEIRIRLSGIVLERENFFQLCSVCDNDDEKIRERIIKIVKERGKFHNPYTESSALFIGTIEETSPGFDLGKLKLGDDVICLTPMAGLPASIDEIGEIDVNYGRIRCTGYAICFETVQMVKIDEPYAMSTIHLVRALEEEGSIYGISCELKPRKINKAAIIGSNIAEAIYYSQMVKDSNGSPVTVKFVIDGSYFAGITREDLKIIFGSLVDGIYFVDLSKPMEAVEKIMSMEEGNGFDAVINLENIKGCESVASLISKDNGLVCYTSMNNRYCHGLLVVDCLGKDITHYGLDGYSSNAYEFALTIVEQTEPALRRLDAFYAGKKKRPQKVRTAFKERTQAAARQIDGFIYKSRVTAEMVEEVLNVAQYDCNVIIQGETGVGKEKVFNLIHQNSSRKDKPCVKINCATISENLAESEFFGYEKGSFTGAQAGGKEGYFELANNGMLFLDEIGSLSLSMQSKLLRVLQESTYYRVGGTKPKHVNVRVICANNIPLKKLVEEGHFREDLYYRLNICLINVPPLRFRKEDISCLAEAFLKNYSEKYGVEKEFSEDAYRQLEEYHWPGNVRELENTVHRLYIAEKDDVIDGYAVDELINRNMLGEIVLDMRKEMNGVERIDFNQLMDEQEKKIIAYALKKKGTTRKAAEFLGIPQTTLARKKLKHDL
ncbi:MAG: sigma 54-interacting transcriptional regulator [Firmicutes bacterium]|nr:sigma 54-interacting transcriptional regulator [Bacillota bacterium]